MPKAFSSKMGKPSSTDEGISQYTPLLDLVFRSKHHPARHDAISCRSKYSVGRQSVSANGGSILSAVTMLFPVEASTLSAVTMLFPAEASTLSAVTMLFPARASTLSAVIVLFPAGASTLSAVTMLFPVEASTLSAVTMLFPVEASTLSAVGVLPQNEEASRRPTECFL